MDAAPHKLSVTKTRPFPTTFYFLDTETELKNIGHKTKLHKLKMGICRRYKRDGNYALVKEDEIIIHHKKDFIVWFLRGLRDRTHVYLIAHNIVYDVTILDLFRELPKHGYILKSTYSKGQVTILRWAKGTSRITMLDNGNIFGGTLAKWGEIFDVPKIDIDFETCSQEELEIYCGRDVEIMVRCWGKWMKFGYENDCGGFRETIGSTAFNAWRHAHMQSGVFVHKENKILLLERSAYHGGRVEAFHQGRLDGDHYYYLDVNSMYGFIMLQNYFPTGLQGHSDRMSIRRMVEKLERYSVIARVRVNVDEPAFISKIGGYSCYPLGRFETTLTTNELLLSLQNGWLEEVHEFSWYAKSGLFSSYVNRFYGLRMLYRSEGNMGFETICKLMINSLYGKFGQTGIHQNIIGSVAADEVWNMTVIDAQTGRHGSQTALGGSVYEEYHEGEGYHAIPAIAAHVTADARLYLLSMIRRAGWENVYYCDTDSLIVNRAGYYNLESEIAPDVLGKLKVETQSDWLIVNAPKDYEMEGRRKIKGVSKNAVEIDDGVFLQEQWMRLAGLIRQGFDAGYTSKEIIKHQQRVIHSGRLSNEGRIDPFILF